MNDTEKYTSMLNKARSFIKRWEGVDAIDSKLAMSELKEIFPELNEGEDEDERIRKAISQCVEDMRGLFEKLYRVHHKNAIAWLEKQGKQKPTDKVEPKFKVGDIISNGKVIYRVDNIVKNCIGQDSYFLVDIEKEKKGNRYRKLYDSEGNTHNDGEIAWLCEQVDRLFSGILAK